MVDLTPLFTFNTNEPNILVRALLHLKISKLVGVFHFSFFTIFPNVHILLHTITEFIALSSLFCFP
jgi:hypothetical protein